MILRRILGVILITCGLGGFILFMNTPSDVPMYVPLGVFLLPFIGGMELLTYKKKCKKSESPPPQSELPMSKDIKEPRGQDYE